MDAFERAVGQTMRETRESKGVTQVKLAQLLKVEPELVRNVELGIRPLEVGEFFDWTAALGVDDELGLFDLICKRAK